MCSAKSDSDNCFIVMMLTQTTSDGLSVCTRVDSVESLIVIISG